jgi:hypothetical protein
VHCVADCIADCIRFGIPQPTAWEHFGNQIDAAMDHVASGIVNTNHKKRRLFSFEAKLLSAPWHHFGCKNGFVFVHCNLVGVEMPAHARFGPIQYA